jgi:hypothetical protein
MGAEVVVAVTAFGVEVDGLAVDELGLPKPYARMGELPPLLGALRRARSKVAGARGLRVVPEGNVSYGLVQRVLDTATSAGFTALALDESPSGGRVSEGSEPFLLWDGRAQLGLPAQTSVLLRITRNEWTVLGARPSPTRLPVIRDRTGEPVLDALDKALVDLTEALPEQQTVTLEVSDEVSADDLFGVLEACTVAGLPYVELRSLSAP